jgi:hypothetical protein
MQKTKILKKVICTFAIITTLVTPFLANKSQIIRVSAIGPSVAITNIETVGTNYSVSFTPSGYTQAQGEIHTHFYYNTEANTVMDKMFSGVSPYSLDTTTKPAGTTQLCAIVAEANHVVLANSGNCFTLPGVTQTTSSSSSVSSSTISSSSNSSSLQNSSVSSTAVAIGGAITITQNTNVQSSSTNSENKDFCIVSMATKLAINTNDCDTNNSGITNPSNVSLKGGEPAGNNCPAGGNRAFNTKGMDTNNYGRAINPDDCEKSKKQITSIVANTDLFQFEDGSKLTLARKGWDGSIKGIAAGDQLVVEEPCQGSFGQVALTFKKGISEGGLKLSEIDQNNLFPNLVGDLTNGCNMSITGFDKEDVSEARVYLGDDFGQKLNNGIGQSGGALANGTNKIQDEAELEKVLEKATSGLKDTLKTQVRLAAGPCKFPYLCPDEVDYALGLETESGELFSFDSNNSGIPTVDSWSWGTTNPSVVYGSGMGAGKVAVSDFSFTASKKNYVGHVTLIKQRTEDKKYIGTVTIVKKGEPNSSIDLSQYQPILDVFQNTNNVIEQAVGPCKPPYLCDFVSIDAKTGHVSLIKGKQTQGATFGEKVNAGLNAAGGALANGVDSSSNKPRKFIRVVQNGRLVNPETGEFLQAQYSNSPWKTADISIDENGQYYVSIPSAFKQFSITKGVLDYSVEKGSNIILARTGGSSDSNLGTGLVLFFILVSFITMKTYEKN